MSVSHRAKYNERRSSSDLSTGGACVTIDITLPGQIEQWTIMAIGGVKTFPQFYYMTSTYTKTQGLTAVSLEKILLLFRDK